jgi:PEGA domain
MRRNIVAGLLLGIVLLTLGCNPKLGIIALDTNPQGAAVYLNGVQVGDTPAKFQYDMNKPVTLKILKDGYKPKEEKITVDWVKSEYHQGNYSKGDYLINGVMQKGFQVNTARELMKAD